jgi:predicted nucleic acid-binding protein
VTVLVDSNVPLYLVGADHPNKDSAQRRLDDLISMGERLVTDLEVLQEILHRYTPIQRPGAIQPAFDAVLGVVDEVLPVDRASSPSTRTSTASPACHGSRESLRPPVGRTGHASDARG